MISQTTKIISEIAKDAGQALARARKSTLEGIAQVACKASYPILGNLSCNLQTRIENLVGRESYNGVGSTITSVISNGVLAGIGIYNVVNKFFPNYPDCSSVAAFYGALLCIRIDLGLRSCLGDDLKKPIGSLPGKIVSLPFDALTYAYDAGKNYLKNVKRRVEIEGGTQ
jgi:hypothetical protein